MPLLEHPSLENAFVRLEPLEERHRELLREAANDPDLWRFASVNQHGSDFDAWMAHRFKEIDRAGEATWAVWDKASNSYCGSTSYLAVQPRHRRVEIGWTWYAKRAWSGPVNPSCKRLLFAYGFEALSLNRIELKLDATNLRSFRAVSRLGARFEGIHRAHMVMPDGRIRDTAWFSVLKEEWLHVRDGLDARLEEFEASRP
ncbi:MAG: GNAT family protein [Hyphomonadaceae bacterium]